MKTASIKLLRLMINSVISKTGEKFAALDISNFYLDTPMKKAEYVKIQFSKIPLEFVDEYNLQEYAHKVWVYFECLQGAYELPQYGILANNLIRSRLEKEGYYETETTPGLWHHKWRPIMFCLIVDDFGV